MKTQYAYPKYDIDFTGEALGECCDTVVRLLDEVGFAVDHAKFLSHIEGKPGIRIRGSRVHFDEALSRQYLDAFVAEQSGRPVQEEPVVSEQWTVQTNGYSMDILDIESEQVRRATRQDLRDCIKLANSFGVGGYYPVMPQDLPPIMRALACFKTCWESSDNIEPFDYQQPEQTRYIYEMHRVMDKPFHLTLCVPQAMTIDPKDISVLLDFHGDLKGGGNINLGVLTYGMVGITKPITQIGCATMTLAETLAVRILVNLFDPDLETGISLHGGQPTDLRHACWAFGSPRGHLFRYLNARTTARFCGVDPGAYAPPRVLLETSSPAVDEQAAMEKMAHGLIGAMQGARTFTYAGVLCVDDLYSPVQFVIDVEMVEYIREMIESFDPHPDIISVAGLYEELRDVCLDKDMFLSHINTVDRFRNIVPSSDRIVREKLQSWLTHQRTLKDRAREEAIDRIRNAVPFELDSDKQKELDRIYARAEANLIK